MIEYLEAGDLWWDGRLRTGTALRLDPAGRATPVPVAEIPPGAPRRRFPGTLLPGLADEHVHAALADLATVRAGGLASVWDLGGVPDKIADLARRGEPDPTAPDPPRPHPTAPDRPRAGAGPEPGRPAGVKLPRIRFAGPFLTAPGGYPSDREWAPAGSWREVRAADDAAEAVAAVHAIGATLIKVVAHRGGPMLPAGTMTALVQAAHRLSLPVVVHAEGSGTVAAALDADADVLAHTPWTEPLDRGLVRACAARQRWISTLDIHGWGALTAARITAVGNLRLFLEYGGVVRYGTDLGNGPLPPGVNAREIRALQDAGLSPADVLTAMAGPGVCWVPGGLDLEPSRFADVLATARVVDDAVRPRF